MRKLIISGLILASISATSTAYASEQAACRELSRTMAQVGPAMRSFLDNLRRADPTRALPQFTGEELAALEKLQQVHSQLMPVFDAYVTQIEDTAYVMQKCAR